eukprot:936624-Prymnesium_polylepis.1
MSRRTATWRQSVHSTFVVTMNERVGRLPSDQDSRLRNRELYTARAVAKQPRCRHNVERPVARDQ